MAKVTKAQKQKQVEKENNQIDKATIIIVIILLIVCIITGILIGRLLYELAMANA